MSGGTLTRCHSEGLGGSVPSARSPGAHWQRRRRGMRRARFLWAPAPRCPKRLEPGPLSDRMALDGAICLAFKDRCEEAVRFYTSLIPNSKLHELVVSDGDGPFPKGAVAQASFTIAGIDFVAFDGGSDMFATGMGSSIMIGCDTQAEIDKIWEGLARNGGEKSMCGWVRDRFGFWWQVFPKQLLKWTTDDRHGDARAAMAAMMKMGKLDMAKLEAAYRGGKKAKTTARKTPTKRTR